MKELGKKHIRKRNKFIDIDERLFAPILTSETSEFPNIYQ